MLGRGYGHDEINEKIRSKGWEKSKVFSEIPVDELRSILKTCKVGVVSLNLMHKSNNIPGKFVSYLRENLPVMVLANEGNDLVELVNSHKLGHAFDGEYTVTDLENAVSKFLSESSKNSKIYERFFNSNYSVEESVTSSPNL